MGDVKPLGQDPATQAQHELVSAIAQVQIYGSPASQETSNGQEFMFHCPICIEDDGKGEGHRAHLFVAKATTEGRVAPFVGCRIHDSSADYKRIKKALIDAGVATTLLESAPASKRSTLGTKGMAKFAYAEFKSRGDGIGEKSPIPNGAIQRWQAALYGGSKQGNRALEFLASRGLLDETIKAAQIGLNGNKLILPIRGADGKVVSARVRALGPDGQWRPFLHPKQIDPETGKHLSYGRPTRLYGVRELALNAPADTPVVWAVAGEFDRLRLLQEGQLTVTGTSGEGSLPRLEDAEYLAGYEVWIAMDCDSAGRKAAQKWAAACSKIGVEQIRIVDLDPNRDDGYDISNFLDEYDSPDGEFDGLALLIDKAAAASLYELPDADAADLSERTDRRMAEIVAAQYAGELQFVTAAQIWINWDGQRWSPAPSRDNAPATNAIVAVARDLRKQIPELAGGDEEEAKALRGYLHPFLNRQHSSVREHLSALPRMRTPLEALDRLPVLNTPQGILDLETGKVQPHDPKAMLRWITNGSYLRGEKFPQWTAFLKRVLPSQELRRYVQKLLGYSLLDGNPHRLLIFVKGGTSTGKSVFAETVMQALGSYAGPFNMSLLRDNQDERPRADIVESLTQRIIFASETSSAWHLHSDAIKRMTGGDTIKARLPHAREYVERIPAFTPWVRTNEVPQIKGSDAALKRRLMIVPFDQHIAQEQEDPRAMNLLRRTSGDAVITWAVRGLFAFLRDGLDDVPLGMLHEREEFAVETSPLNAFINEMCEYGPETDSEYRTDVKDLYNAYENWCSVNGEREVMSSIGFGKGLSGVGIKRFASNGANWRLGFRLKSTMLKAD